MSSDVNPYANYGQIADPMQASVGVRLADRGKRFVGALIDGMIGILLIGPGYGIMVAGQILAQQSNGADTTMMFVGIGLLALGGIAQLGVNIYLLVTRSQTIGKLLMKTQIMDINTHRPAGFVNTFLLRMLLNGVIGAIPCVGAIYSLADPLFIFREDKRCLHDLIAQTYVADIS